MLFSEKYVPSASNSNVASASLFISIFISLYINISIYLGRRTDRLSLLFYIDEDLK